MSISNVPLQFQPLLALTTIDIHCLGWFILSMVIHRADREFMEVTGGKQPVEERLVSKLADRASARAAVVDGTFCISNLCTNNNCNFSAAPYLSGPNEQASPPRENPTCKKGHEAIPAREARQRQKHPTHNVSQARPTSQEGNCILRIASAVPARSEEMT